MTPRTMLSRSWAGIVSPADALCLCLPHGRLCPPRFAPATPYLLHTLCTSDAILAPDTPRCSATVHDGLALPPPPPPTHPHPHPPTPTPYTIKRHSCTAIVGGIQEHRSDTTAETRNYSFRLQLALPGLSMQDKDAPTATGNHSCAGLAAGVLSVVETLCSKGIAGSCCYQGGSTRRGTRNC